MKHWKFITDDKIFYILVNWYEHTHDWSVTLRYVNGFEVELKNYKRKSDVNRYLKKWGIKERI